MFVAVRVVYQRRMPLANSVSAELNALAALRHVSQETLPHHQLSYLRLCACKSSMGAVTAVAALAGPESSSALDFFFSFFYTPTVQSIDKTSKALWTMFFNYVVVCAAR